jgi:hypothetical protein
VLEHLILPLGPSEPKPATPRTRALDPSALESASAHREIVHAGARALFRRHYAQRQRRRERPSVCRSADLADYHGLKGRTAKADKLAAIAEAYYQAAPDDDDEPEAAAMAMPVPRRPINTNAVSTTRVPKPREEGDRVTHGGDTGTIMRHSRLSFHFARRKRPRRVHRTGPSDGRSARA